MGKEMHWTLFLDLKDTRSVLVALLLKHNFSLFSSKLHRALLQSDQDLPCQKQEETENSMVRVAT